MGTERADRVEPVSEGQVLVDGVAAVVGVLRYAAGEIGPDAVAEYVPPETLADEASLATLRGAPITIEHATVGMSHPGEPVGAVADAWFDAETGQQRVRVRLWDVAALEALRAGKVELSCGYHAESEEAAGDHAGEAYDRVQRSRRYNHVAIVDRARAGRAARLHLDRSTMRKDTAPAPIRSDEELPTGTVRLEWGDKSITMTIPVAAVEQLAQSLGAVQPPVVEQDPPPPTETIEEALDAGADPEQDPEKREDSVPVAAARARAALERAVCRVLPADYDYDAATDDTLRADAIAVLAPHRADSARDLASVGSTRASSRLAEILTELLEYRAPVRPHTDSDDRPRAPVDLQLLVASTFR